MLPFIVIRPILHAKRKQTLTKDYFHLDEVNHQELMGVLLFHFNHCQNIELGVYRYQKEDKPYFLDLTVNRNGQVTKIVPSPRFPQEELKFIEAIIIENLVDNHGTRVGRFVIFCHDKVDGYFRYDDIFQLLPVPPSAPKPNVAVADHPFLLEFKYKACPDSMIDSTRKGDQATKYVLLLNLLSNRRIYLGNRNDLFGWVWNTSDPQNVISEWKQLGYTYKELSTIENTFSDISNIPPIDREPFQKYYGEAPVRTSEPLRLPNNLGQSLEHALSLSDRDERKLSMACSCYYQAQYVA